MTPEERELRRALDARSGSISPDFRARLSAALAEDKAASNLLPALALVAVAILVFATVGVLLLARQNRSLTPGGDTTTPTPTATSTPTAAPTPPGSPVAGVLNKPPTQIALGANAQLSAPSTNVIWALMVSQYLYRSTDRGATWVQRPMVGPAFGGPRALQMSFVNDHEGWLTIDAPIPPTDRCLQQRVNVWHTSDAGANWQLLGWNGISDSQCKSSLSFVDSSHGFLGATNPYLPTVIYRTSDGGHTWIASAPMHSPPDYDPAFAGGVPAGGNIYVGPVQARGSTLLVDVASQFNKYVYRSIDGGATWTYLAEAPFRGNGTTDYEGWIVLVTASRWLQVGSCACSGGSMETVDAGVSWHLYATDYSLSAPIAAEFAFADSRVGYGTVGGSISRTVDGGLHWTNLHTPGT